MVAPVSDPLQELVRMAGPAAAAELFARFDEDLQTTRSGLGRAAASGVSPGSIRPAMASSCQGKGSPRPKGPIRICSIKSTRSRKGS